MLNIQFSGVATSLEAKNKLKPSTAKASVWFWVEFSDSDNFDEVSMSPRMFWHRDGIGKRKRYNRPILEAFKSRNYTSVF